MFRRGAGAWFSSNRGATQQQWAYARVNEALSDIKNEKAINHGNDNDIFEDSLDYSPPDEEQNAQLVEVNGTEVDLSVPPRVTNAIEAAMSAKEEYADEIGDCGTGVGEEMGQTILDGDLTPEIVTSGGDIAQYGPATYLDGHGDEGPATDDPPTDWGREEWLGIVDGGSPRCGPVQLGLWGYYLQPFQDMKDEVEAAMEDEDMAENGDDVPEEYRFSNPGEAVEKAQDMGVGDDRDLAGDELIHTHGSGEDTVFMPGPWHEDLVDMLREMGELAEHGGGDVDVRLPMPSEDVQLLYPDEETAAEAAEAMGLSGTHAHDYEGDTWYMPGESHGAFVDVVSGLDAGMAGAAPVAKLNEYKSVGPISFRGTREGDLDECEIPVEDHQDHYFNSETTKSESSYPLVDGEGYLRRGNLDAAWNMRGQGDLGMPRDSAERLMLNLGLVFGPPDSETNPLPQDAYEERDDVGTPFAEEAAALAGAIQADDPETGEDLGGELGTQMTEADKTAALGGGLSRLMAGKMEEMAHHEEQMGHAEMMEEMADYAGMSTSHMRAIRRGDVDCPGMDAIEAMSEILDTDMGMLVAAAERDGCQYSAASYHGDEDGDEAESMADTSHMSTDTTELKATLTEKNERIEELEAALSELREENDELQTAAEAVDEAEQAYAAALADHVPRDAEALREDLSMSTMQDWLADIDGAGVEDGVETEPTVRSGASGTNDAEAASLSPDERDRLADLEQKKEKLTPATSKLAKHELSRVEDEIADLRE